MKNTDGKRTYAINWTGERGAGLSSGYDEVTVTFAYSGQEQVDSLAAEGLDDSIIDALKQTYDDASVYCVEAERQKLLARIGPANAKKLPFLTVGSRVVLPTNKRQGWRRQAGEIIDVQEGSSGMYTIEIDEKYRDKDVDGGIREVYIGFIVPEPKKRKVA